MTNYPPGAIWPVEYVRDGEYARTADVWAQRTIDAMGCDWTYRIVEAVASLPDKPATLVYDIAQAAPRDIGALVEMLRDDLCPAIERAGRPIHVVVICTLPVPRRFLGFSLPLGGAARLHRDQLRTIQEVLGADLHPVTPLSTESDKDPQ